MSFKSYQIGYNSKIIAEEILSDTHYLGEVIGIGENTIAIKPSFKTQKESTLLISSEKEKLPFIKRLSKYYKDFFVEELNILENKDCFLIPIMQPVILDNKNDIKIMLDINKKYLKLSNFDYNALNNIKSNKVRIAIQIALKSVENDNAFLDLHSLQFVIFNKELICIDPVYY